MSWINKNQSNQTGDQYPVLRMAMRSTLPRSEYVNALNFWKSLERKYNERRRRLVTERQQQMFVQKAARDVKREIDEARASLETDEDLSVHTDEGAFADAEDDEFSDVDSEFFTDPGAQYYSGLDKEGWMRITSELEKLQKQNETQISLDRRGIVRGLVFAGILIAAVIVTALSVVWKTYAEPEEVLCNFHCSSGPSLTEELVRGLFPLASIEDEV